MPAGELLALCHELRDLPIRPHGSARVATESNCARQRVGLIGRLTRVKEDRGCGRRRARRRGRDRKAGAHIPECAGTCVVRVLPLNERVAG